MKGNLNQSILESLFKFSGLVFISQLIANLSVFLINILALKYWSVEEHGAYVLYLSVANILILVSDFGITSKLGVKEIASCKSNIEISNAVYKALTSIIPISLICLIAGYLLPRIFNSDTAFNSNTSTHIIIWIVAGVMARFGSMLAIGLEKGGFLLLLSIFNQPLWTIGIIICVFAKVQYSFPLIISVFSGFSIILSLFAIFFFIYKHGLKFKFHKFNILSYYKESILFFIPFLSSTGFQSYSLLVLASFTKDLHVISMVQIMLQFGLVIRLLIQPITVAWFPIIARTKSATMNRNHSIELLSILIQVVTYIYILYLIFLSIFSKLIFTQLYGKPVQLGLLVLLVGSITLDSVKNICDQIILNEKNRGLLSIFEILKFPVFIVPFYIIGGEVGVLFFASIFLIIPILQLLPRIPILGLSSSTKFSLYFHLISVLVGVFLSFFESKKLVFVLYGIIVFSIQFWVIPYSLSKLRRVREPN